MELGEYTLRPNDQMMLSLNDLNKNNYLYTIKQQVLWVRNNTKLWSWVKSRHT